jgi:hypothetical protein
MNHWKSLAALAAVGLLAAPAAAKDVAGVKLPDSVTVEGKELKLNGAGIRKKFVIKVYIGALYLETPATDPAAVISSDQVKSVHMHFMRDVGREKILDAFKEGFEKNSKDKAAALSAQLDQVAPSISDLKEGTELVVTYVPGKGSTIVQKGGKEVQVAGKDFGDALFRNWLGSHPADDDLKQEMLAGHP